METSYPVGIDCSWIAADRDGQIAAFVTGGVGPIPVALTSDRVSLEDLEERISALPRRSEVHLLVNIKRPDGFIAMAERGFFVFDWSDVHRTAREEIHGYELVATPINPISATDLDDDLAKTLGGLKLMDVSFSEERVLDIRKHLACREAE